MVSSVLLPFLSFLPAIFHVFLGVLISFLHLGHLAITFPFHSVTLDQVKTLSIILELRANNSEKAEDTPNELRNLRKRAVLNAVEQHHLYPSELREISNRYTKNPKEETTKIDYHKHHRTAFKATQKIVR